MEGEIYSKVLIQKFIILGIQISLETHPTTHWKLDAPAGTKSLKETAFTALLPDERVKKGDRSDRTHLESGAHLSPVLGHNAH